MGFFFNYYYAPKTLNHFDRITCEHSGAHDCRCTAIIAYYVCGTKTTDLSGPVCRQRSDEDIDWFGHPAAEVFRIQVYDLAERRPFTERRTRGTEVTLPFQNVVLRFSALFGSCLCVCKMCYSMWVANPCLGPRFEATSSNGTHCFVDDGTSTKQLVVRRVFG